MVERGRGGHVLVVVLDGPEKQRRGKEYDTMSSVYADSIAAEVLPRVEKNYHMKLTKDPDGRAARRSATKPDALSQPASAS